MHTVESDTAAVTCACLAYARPAAMKRTATTHDRHGRPNALLAHDQHALHKRPQTWEECLLLYKAQGRKTAWCTEANEARAGAFLPDKRGRYNDTPLADMLVVEDVMEVMLAKVERQGTTRTAAQDVACCGGLIKIKQVI